MFVLNLCMYQDQIVNSKYVWGMFEISAAFTPLKTYSRGSQLNEPKSHIAPNVQKFPFIFFVFERLWSATILGSLTYSILIDWQRHASFSFH